MIEIIWCTRNINRHAWENLAIVSSSTITSTSDDMIRARYWICMWESWRHPTKTHSLHVSSCDNSTSHRDLDEQDFDLQILIPSVSGKKSLHSLPAFSHVVWIFAPWTRHDWLMIPGCISYWRWHRQQLLPHANRSVLNEIRWYLSRHTQLYSASAVVLALTTVSLLHWHTLVSDSRQSWGNICFIHFFEALGYWDHETFVIRPIAFLTNSDDLLIWENVCPEKLHNTFGLEQHALGSGYCLWSVRVTCPDDIFERRRWKRETQTCNMTQEFDARNTLRDARVLHNGIRKEARESVECTHDNFVRRDRSSYQELIPLACPLVVPNFVCSGRGQDSSLTCSECEIAEWRVTVWMNFNIAWLYLSRKYPELVDSYSLTRLRDSTGKMGGRNQKIPQTPDRILTAFGRDVSSLNFRESPTFNYFRRYSWCSRRYFWPFEVSMLRDTRCECY